MAVPLPSPAQAAVVASIVIVGTYLYSKLYYHRFKLNAHIPQLPSSLLFGHLIAFDAFTKKGVLDRHPDVIFSEMHQAAGKPPVMLLDNWPIVPPMAIVANHEVAEQVSKPSPLFQYSAPKSQSLARVVDLIGPKTILLKQNDDWKQVRRRFNPGFAPQHLMTLLPLILDKASLYFGILDELAKSDKPISLDGATTNLTFDIIGAVTMGVDMNAQHLDPSQQGEMVVMYKQLIKTFADDKLQLPWWLIPRVHLQRRRLGAKISAQLQDIVRESFANMKAGSETTGSRSILSLSLKDVDTLTQDILDETCDQLKTFLFAGHDTTSTTITWMVYELSRTPHALKKVREELDRLFGPGRAGDPTFVRQKLLEPGGDALINQMVYISAVLKEVLRLYAPAGTIRYSNPGTGFVLKTSQGDYNVDGNWIYLNHRMIHLDPGVYGDTAEQFVPERWLQPEGLPASAWRPFERGPRNCIGQELANIEARIIIAMLISRYDFTKTIQISGKPVDGMMVKIKMAS
ncbi:putative cytochrome P450 monooxygenase [Stachybotrys elegans]|uniref:Cytochrome P450 monooxygenase n=1 Tax=Stachybotrys elegans TaxID=80388 RepID=A0A8K0SVE5_9HYPO|nr:putative cytochrome P450 monooxygenase [Stachybotrys elegans]